MMPICAATTIGLWVEMRMQAGITGRPSIFSPIMPSVGRVSPTLCTGAMLGELDPSQAIPQAETAARQAIELDNSLHGHAQLSEA